MRRSTRASWPSTGSPSRCNTLVARSSARMQTWSTVPCRRSSNAWPPTCLRSTTMRYKSSFDGRSSAVAKHHASAGLLAPIGLIMSFDDQQRTLSGGRRQRSRCPVQKVDGAVGPCDVEGLEHPWNVGESMVQELFERFLARVPEPLARSTDSWSQLEAARGEDARPVRGPFGLEWFWLLPKGGSETPGPETAEGLGVFQLQRSGGKTVAQLRHFSVVKLELFKEGLCCLKNLMFARLPAASIRMVLWCQEQGEDGKVMANSQVEAILKELCFRWFRFENKRGLRGKETPFLRRQGKERTMQRPRGEEDPEMPLEVPSLEFCIGQVWLRCASSQSKPVPYSGNLALAAGCLRALKGKDDHDAPPPELEAPKEGKDAGVRSSVALTRCLVKQMEEGVELPEAICQAVNESPELVRSEPSEPNTWMAPGVTGRSVFLRGRSRRYKDGCIFWRSLCMLF
eukprot:g9248.t1